MRTALVSSAVLLTVSISSLLLATIILRAIRTKRDKRLAVIRMELRAILIKLLAGDMTSTDLDNAVKLKTNHFDALSEAIITKIKGEAKETLVEFLEARGAIDLAIARTYQLGAMGRCKAASFLGNIGIKRSRQSLERLLDDRNSEVRTIAARGLGLIGDPRSVPALISRLDRKRKNLPFGTVLVALNRIGSAGYHQLREGLTGEGEWQRAAVVEILGLLGALEVVPEMIEHLYRDPSIEVRIRCARALGRIGSPRAIEPLSECMNLEVPFGLRVVSCGALAQMGDLSSIIAIARFLNENSPTMSRAAANALAQIGGSGILALKACIEADNYGSPHAREALARIQIKERSNGVTSKSAVI